MPSREVRCSCGAINDVDFGSCIRCSRKLGAEPEAAPPAPARVRDDAPMAEPGTSGLLIGGLCSVVFAVQLALALRNGELPLMGGSRIDAIRVGALEASRAVVELEPFRLLSAAFVHFGILHFGLNMLGLSRQARVAEELVGTSRTMITFVSTAVAGHLCTLIAYDDGAATTAGASGGLLGVMGLILGVMWRRKDRQFASQAANVLFYAVLFGFAVNASNAGIAINNSAHIGGLLSGFAFGAVWAKGRLREGRIVRGAALACFGASIVSVILAMTSKLHEQLV